MTDNVNYPLLQFDYRRDYAWKQAYTRLTNQGQALIRRQICEERQISSTLTKDSKLDATIRKEAAQRWAAVVKGEGTLTDTAMTMPIAEAYLHLLQSRAETAKILVKLGETAMHAETILKVRGLAGGSYAAILAEAGPITNYSNPAKLWKRFGLAVDGDRRQGNLAGLSAEDRTAKGVADGYSPRRRALLKIVSDNVIRASDVTYRKVFDEYKEAQLAKGLSKGHANNRALRYVAKRILLHIWQIWHGQR